ncbi:hypothetical protein HYW94_02295, partial [Candidatus Uhrbacteria bacterium]|nr:hypothetical protein [Candidatus Uhrbacteria bacterium]
MPKFSLPKLSLPKFVLPFLSFPWKLPIYSRVKQLIINRSPLGRESSEIKRFSNTWIPDRVGDDNPQKTSTAIPDASYWKRIFEQKEKLMAQTDALKNSFSLSQPVKNLFTHFKVIFNAYSKKLSSQQKGQPSKFFLFKKEQTAQILLLLLVVGTLGVFFTTLASTTNRTKPITYQGRLMDTNYVPVADANYQLKFRIYDALTGGNCKWATGTDTNANNCNTPGAVTTTVSRGFFSIDLGDNTTGNKYFPYDFSDATTYLEITIGSETTTPRRRITAAPYALNSEELGGIAASGFAQLSGATFTGNVTTTALVSSGAISGTTGTFSGLVKQTGSLSTVGAGTTESAYTYSLLRSGLTFTFGGEAFNKIDGAGINDTGFQFPLRYDGGAARANLIIDPSNDGANSYNLVWQVASSTMFSVSRLGAGLFAAGLTANTGTFSIDPSNDGANSYNLVWQVASSTMFSVSRLGAGLFAAGLTATTGTFSTSVSTPSIITASGALGITPAAGSGLNISLSTTGDFAVNTNQLYVDTSSGNVGIGTTTPADLLTLSGTGKFVRADENSTGNSGIVVSLNSTNKGFFGVTG